MGFKDSERAGGEVVKLPARGYLHLPYAIEASPRSPPAGGPGVAATPTYLRNMRHTHPTLPPENPKPSRVDAVPRAHHTVSAQHPSYTPRPSVNTSSKYSTEASLSRNSRRQ